MFWENKFRLFESISTKYLKEKQYYIADCGCEKEYELINVEVNPKGKTYEIKTILFRKIDDWMTKSMQPIWDNKKLQQKLRKEMENEKKGIKKEKEYKPIRYMKLSKNDYKDILLAYTLFYKWAKENLNEDYPLDKIIGVINAMDFVYRGIANDWNGIHNNDFNTIELLDLRIAYLTMSKKEYSKFYDFQSNKKIEERDKREREILKGVICHKCEIPMEEFTLKHAFEGKGHYCPSWLRGKRCSKCGFTIFLPEDIEHYIRENRLHYLIFSGSEDWMKKNEKILTEEIKEIVKENRERKEKTENLWKTKEKRDKKVLKSIRRYGNKSKYFKESGGLKNV